MKLKIRRKCECKNRFNDRNAGKEVCLFCQRFRMHLFMNIEKWDYEIKDKT